jgi:hypothetical protein
MPPEDKDQPPARWLKLQKFQKNPICGMEPSWRLYQSFFYASQSQPGWPTETPEELSKTSLPTFHPRPLSSGWQVDIRFILGVASCLFVFNLRRAQCAAMFGPQLGSWLYSCSINPLLQCQWHQQQVRTWLLEPEPLDLEIVQLNLLRHVSRVK